MPFFVGKKSFRCSVFHKITDKKNKDGMTKENLLSSHLLRNKEEIFSLLLLRGLEQLPAFLINKYAVFQSQF